jgi:6,7-dimethyl-8-ribityllumazine synthase
MPDRPHVLILSARFYDDIADQLVGGAVAVLEAAGTSHQEMTVPGAFELPAALAMAIDSNRYDGFVVLGCVIRGETSHYDHVCNECAHGLSTLATQHRIALGFGLITAETRDQAWERAAIDRRNKGADVANACLAMMSLRRDLAAPTGE